MEQERTTAVDGYQRTDAGWAPPTNKSGLTGGNLISTWKKSVEHGGVKEEKCVRKTWVKRQGNQCNTKATAPGMRGTYWRTKNTGHRGGVP